ncbi:MAG: histidine triad nucleotide-binding protein [Verrucomicrobia bacterium]|nr:histidine triad nucleotide-binding protein [Verrucomicrobiota bacterium]
MTTVFGRIIKGELPCDKVYETENVIAFKDIAPKAPIHILIVPKKEIPTLQDVTVEDYPLIGEMIGVAQTLAKKLGIEDGYRLLVNNGPNSGQAVYHLHFHLIGGKRLSHDLG